MQPPRYEQVLTGALPSGAGKGSWVNDIIGGKRPPRPTDPSQNRQLKDRIWDVITTSWSGEPQLRCGLSVMYYAFSTPGPQDLLVEFPPVGRKNLLRLAEELLYTFLALPLDPRQRATLGTVQEYVSDVISRGGSSPTIPPSAKAVALMGTFRKVCFHR
jgi:hypothetical protein